MMPPIAERVAQALPEIAAKIEHAIMPTTARPPFSFPTSLLAALIICLPMPPVGHDGTSHNEQRNSQQDDRAGVFITEGHEQRQARIVSYGNQHGGQKEGQRDRNADYQQGKQQYNCYD